MSTLITFQISRLFYIQKYKFIKYDVLLLIKLPKKYKVVKREISEIFFLML